MDELTLLEDYAQVFGKGLRYRFVIFSLGGFTDELLEAAKTEGVQLITLDDLYSL